MAASSSSSVASFAPEIQAGSNGIRYHWGRELVAASRVSTLHEVLVVALCGAGAPGSSGPAGRRGHGRVRSRSIRSGASVRSAPPRDRSPARPGCNRAGPREGGRRRSPPPRSLQRRFGGRVIFCSIRSPTRSRRATNRSPSGSDLRSPQSTAAQRPGNRSSERRSAQVGMRDARRKEREAEESQGEESEVEPERRRHIVRDGQQAPPLIASHQQGQERTETPSPASGCARNVRRAAPNRVVSTCRSAIIQCPSPKRTRHHVGEGQPEHRNVVAAHQVRRPCTAAT